MKNQLILIFVFLTTLLNAQSGDITINPFKDSELKKYQKQIEIVLDAFTKAKSTEEIMTLFNADPEPDDTDSEEPTLLSIPAGTSVGSSANDVEGGVQLGLQIGQLSKFHLKAVFNLTDKKETIEGESINNILMNPTLSSQSFIFDGAWWPVNLGKEKIIEVGPYARFGVGITDFKTEMENESKGGSIYHASLGISFLSKPFKAKIGQEENNVYQFGVELGYAFRGITGDLTFEENQDLRNSILGFDNTKLSNFESTIFLRLNNVRPYFRISNLSFQDSDNNNINIDGLSGTRFFWGVEVLTSFFKTKI